MGCCGFHRVTCEQFHTEFLGYYSVVFEKLTLKITDTSPRGQWINTITPIPTGFDQWCTISPHVVALVAMQAGAVRVATVVLRMGDRAVRKIGVNIIHCIILIRRCLKFDHSYYIIDHLKFNIYDIFVIKFSDYSHAIYHPSFKCIWLISIP